MSSIRSDRLVKRDQSSLQAIALHGRPPAISAIRTQLDPPISKRVLLLLMLVLQEALQVQVIDGQTISSTTKEATRNLTGAVAMVVAIAVETTTMRVDSTVEVEQAEVQAPTYVEMLEAMI